PLGGSVEPHLAHTADGSLWCTYATRGQAVVGERDNWTLLLRRFDPATARWGAEQVLTLALPAGAAHREPGLPPLPVAGARLIFSTDRTGGRGLALLPLDGAGNPTSAVAPFAADPAEAWAPSAISFEGEVWVFHRGDRAYAPAQLATLSSTPAS